jgi:hypothetical protein
MKPSAGRADARLPLALLAAIRQADTPPPTLADEPAGSMFPHRLGLSDVVEEQIRHFRRLRRLGRGVDEAHVIALLELVARRRDAASVFGVAGRELALLYLSGRRGLTRSLVRRLPSKLKRRATLRILRRAAERFMLASRVAVAAQPLEVRADGAVTVRAGTYGAACQLYSSLADNLWKLTAREGPGFAHPECQRRGDALCVWRADGSS